MNDRRCTAKLSDGSRRCRNRPIAGGTVCRVHGGAAPQVRRSARARLDALVEPAIEALRVALHSGELMPIIRAATVVLDRTGYGPRVSLDVATERLKEQERGRLFAALEAAGITAEQARTIREVLEREGSDGTVH